VWQGNMYVITGTKFLSLPGLIHWPCIVLWILSDLRANGGIRIEISGA
jgi:Trk-type K+ transport system membrane component